MLSLGQELKKAREERGIMLTDIAGATHISLRFLQAIENDSYDVLPGGVFNRAFVRKFARTVGFDEEQAVRLYEEQLVEMGGEPQRRYYTGVDEIEPNSSSGNGLVLSFLALVILGGGAYFAFLFFNTPSQNSETAVVGNPTPPLSSTPVPVVVTQTPTPTPEQLSELKMEVIAGNDQCWIQIITDDREPDQGLLEIGDVREYKASEKIIIMSLGNTPALKITVNGRQLDPAKLVRSPKSVITQNVILTRDNYQSYLQ
jgi:cytoskeleton protein RodZ